MVFSDAANDAQPATEAANTSTDALTQCTARRAVRTAAAAPPRQDFATLSDLLAYTIRAPFFSPEILVPSLAHSYHI